MDLGSEMITQEVTYTFKRFDSDRSPHQWSLFLKYQNIE